MERNMHETNIHERCIVRDGDWGEIGKPLEFGLPYSFTTKHGLKRTTGSSLKELLSSYLVGCTCKEAGIAP